MNKRKIHVSADDNEVKTLHHDNVAVVSVIVVVVTRLGDFVSFGCFWGLLGTFLKAKKPNEFGSILENG